MNDAERDAWLREALRHAPDSDAVPPSGVSETILAQARAAARAATTGAPARPRARPASPLAALWAWLARPPVAAGFASVMAATLVGLLWWDRPMDETMPRPPAPMRERAGTQTPPEVAAIADASAPAAAPTTAAPTARDAAADAPSAAVSKRQVEETAKERASPAEQKKSDAPVPFPPAAPPTQASPPFGAARRDTDANRAGGAGQAEAVERSAPKSAGDVGDAREKPPSAEAAARPSSPAPFRSEPGRLRGEAAAQAGPLAGLLASIAAEPQRWSRQTAGGDAFALEPGWLAWLGELDAAAAGRWRPLGGADLPPADAAGERATTLRLMSEGRLAAVVRVQGTSAQIEAAAPEAGGGRWRATLSAADAERLRAAAQRLGP